MQRSVPAEHFIRIGLVLLIVGLLYARVTGAWFCSYDDFNERHRAMFEDARDPVRVLTTTHFVSYMYRPVTSGLQLATMKVSHDDPLAFRLRNIAMHLVSVAMVYGIMWLIFRSSLIAAGTALLFGLHPMANETVVVAIWTNATAYALFFSSFFFFLWSLALADAGRNWRWSFWTSMACAFVALFTYEPTVIVFGLMIGYLAVRRARGRPVHRSLLTSLAIVIAVELVVFLALRHMMIAHGSPWNSASIIIRNATMYAIALVLPVDFVLSNALFGTPLPTGIHPSARLAILAVVAVAALLSLGFIVTRLPRVRAQLTNVDLPVLLFFAGAIPLGFLPLLLFRDHPSEHDLYPSVAFFAGLLTMLVWQLTRSRLAYGVIVGLLAVSFGSAVWLRNDDVTRCGAIAQNIVTSLPVADWRRGPWHIELATPQSQRLPQPYGMYDHLGLMTLEVPGTGIPGAQEALQLATNNERLTVDVVNPGTMAGGCKNADACFLVSAKGNVSQVPSRNDRALR